MAAIYSNIHLDPQDKWKMMTSNSHTIGPLVMVNSPHCSIVSSDLESLDSLINALTEARQYLFHAQEQERQNT